MSAQKQSTWWNYLASVFAAVFAAALAVALASAFAPAAWADTPAAEQPSLAAGQPSLAAQSDRTYITAPASNASFSIGQPVEIRAYSSIYLFRYGYAVTNYITFKVTKGGKVVHYASDWYNSAGATLSTTFTPKEPGKYKVEISSPGFSQVSEDNFSATDSRTFTVKKASTFKSVVPDFTSTRSSKTKVELSWTNSGTGAMIYRATTRDGKYKLVKKTTEQSYTDKVSKKNNYFYKIKFYLRYNSKTYTSKFSHIEQKFAKEPAAPTITAVSKVKKGVKIAWKQPTDCGHYTILRGTKKNGTYEALDYVSGDAKTTYVDKTAKKGKTYYYQVESNCYLDWSGKILYGTSDPVKFKVK